VIDHIGVNVRNFAASKRFYEEALNPLGYAIIMDWGSACMFAEAARQGVLWVGQAGAVAPYHLALAAPDRAKVDTFYEAAMATGGKDNGAPGLRPQYHPNYYGAFVLDPDGYNVEAVCHKPE